MAQPTPQWIIRTHASKPAYPFSGYKWSSGFFSCPLQRIFYPSLQRAWAFERIGTWPWPVIWGILCYFLPLGPTRPFRLDQKLILKHFPKSVVTKSLVVNLSLTITVTSNSSRILYCLLHAPPSFGPWVPDLVAPRYPNRYLGVRDRRIFCRELWSLGFILILALLLHIYIYIYPKSSLQG